MHTRYTEINKKCASCDKIADLKHILFQCKNNSDQKDLYLQTLQRLDNHFVNVDLDNKVTKMMNLSFKTRNAELFNEAVNATIAFVTKTYLSHVRNN